MFILNLSLIAFPDCSSRFRFGERWILSRNHEWIWRVSGVSSWKSEFQSHYSFISSVLTNRPQLTDCLGHIPVIFFGFVVYITAFAVLLTFYALHDVDDGELWVRIPSLRNFSLFVG
jgi:hypothetical protein